MCFPPQPRPANPPPPLCTQRRRVRLRWSLQPSAPFGRRTRSHGVGPILRRDEKRGTATAADQHSITKENKSKITPASVAAVAPVCKFFEQGRCTKGSACPFAHAAEALGENGPRPSIAKQQALRPGDRQRNATIAEGARIATRSSQERGVGNESASPGPICSPVGRANLSRATLLRSSTNPTTIPCLNHSCLSSSSYSRTTASAPVCKFFMKGRCTEGSSCLFSHETPHQKEQPA